MYTRYKQINSRSIKNINNSVAKTDLHSAEGVNTSFHCDVPLNHTMENLLQNGFICPKLSMSQPCDPFEEEADRMALTAMRDEKPKHPSGKNKIEMHTEKTGLHHAQGIPKTIERKINGFQGCGNPLSKSERDYFEPRFEYDFSNVKIHTNNSAAELANSINAKAFTLGCNVVFGSGYYVPGSETGRQLIAHELAHIVQQNEKGYTYQSQFSSHLDNSLIARKLYTYENFSFSMNEDGAILVKKDDWISKYSASLNNGDTSKIDEYVRLVTGYPVRIDNPDLIIEGEIIYHGPTLKSYLEKNTRSDGTQTDNGQLQAPEIESNPIQDEGVPNSKSSYHM
jgi:hypothetical protein